MPKPSVTVEGAQEIIDHFNNASRIIQTEGKKYLDELGAWTVEKVKDNIQQQGAIDLGEMHGGIHHVTKVTNSNIETTVRPSDKADEYTIFVERGTKPHWPPRDALEGWADRHGIPVFLVQRKIARDGTEPRHMFRDAYNELLKRVDNKNERFAVKILGKL